MKKLILLSLLSFGIYSCSHDVYLEDPLPDCNFTNSGLAQINVNIPLLFPNGLSTYHHSLLNNITAFNFTDVFIASTWTDNSNPQSYVSVNYVSDLSGCMGEHTERYIPNSAQSNVNVGPDYFRFPSDSFGNHGEYSVKMKSEVFSPDFGSGNQMYYILWVSDGQDFIYGVHFPVGIKVDVSYPDNGGRQSQQQQKLIINDSKNYIYSGGVRTTI